MISLLQAGWRTPKWSDTSRGVKLYNDFYSGLVSMFGNLWLLNWFQLLISTMGMRNEWNSCGLYTHFEFVHEFFSLSIIVWTHYFFYHRAARLLDCESEVGEHIFHLSNRRTRTSKPFGATESSMFSIAHRFSKNALTYEKKCDISIISIILPPKINKLFEQVDCKYPLPRLDGLLHPFVANNGLARPTFNVVGSWWVKLLAMPPAIGRGQWRKGRWWTSTCNPKPTFGDLGVRRFVSTKC